MSVTAFAASIIFLMASLSILRKYRQNTTLELFDMAYEMIGIAVVLIIWLVGDIPTEWKAIVTVVTIVLLVLTAFWSNKRSNIRKEAIWKAIKKWVELPLPIRFHSQKDMLPLAEKPPELADEVEKCLKRKYPSIWANLQKLRQEYYGWKNENVAERFTKYEGDRAIINITYVNQYNRSKCDHLLQLHCQLAKQIKSEILDKHYTRLKC